MMSDSVRYIHTQAQARSELDRRNAIARARYADKKQRMQEDVNYAQKARIDHAQNCKQSRADKRKRIGDDPLHVDAGKNAKRMAMSRILARANQQAQDSLDRAEMTNKVWERYISYFFSQLMFRISELDTRFADLEV